MTTKIDRWPLDNADLAPRPTPGWSSASPLLTADEAACYLRFDAEGRDMEQAVRSLNRLVERKLLRPCPLGGRNRYSIRELNRFIDEQTEGAA